MCVQGKKSVRIEALYGDISVHAEVLPARAPGLYWSPHPRTHEPRHTGSSLPSSSSSECAYANPPPPPLPSHDLLHSRSRMYLRPARSLRAGLRRCLSFFFYTPLLYALLLVVYFIFVSSFLSRFTFSGRRFFALSRLRGSVNCAAAAAASDNAQMGRARAHGIAKIPFFAFFIIFATALFQGNSLVLEVSLLN